MGYGRVGRRIAQTLSAQGIPYVVAEQNRERVRELREKDIAAVSGDAADPAVLIQAHIAHASMLVIATPDTVSVRRMAEVARTLNPAIELRAAHAQRGRGPPAVEGERRHGFFRRARARIGHDAARARAKRHRGALGYRLMAGGAV